MEIGRAHDNACNLTRFWAYDIAHGNLALLINSHNSCFPHTVICIWLARQLRTYLYCTFHTEGGMVRTYWPWYTQLCCCLGESILVGRRLE